MNADEERAYVCGSNAAWRSMLGQCMRELNITGGTVESLTKERIDVVLLLRRVCAEFGDNEWPDELHLCDVIEKHLARHLHRKPAKKRTK